ncbi:hypothetical protein KM043_014979 [Ampulex compressa]|nr:hypothetical protein KM043_014979 [Ampulex compressa]
MLPRIPSARHFGPVLGRSTRREARERENRRDTGGSVILGLVVQQSWGMSSRSAVRVLLDRIQELRRIIAETPCIITGPRSAHEDGSKRRRPAREPVLASRDVIAETSADLHPTGQERRQESGPTKGADDTGRSVNGQDGFAFFAPAGGPMGPPFWPVFPDEINDPSNARSSGGWNSFVRTDDCE